MKLNIDELAASWRDEPVAHEQVLEAFDAVTRSESRLNAQRDWVEANDFGYGHKAFNGVWHTLIESVPSGFKFLEVGIHKGASLSAVALSAAIQQKEATVVGLGPLNGVGGYYDIRDYEVDVKLIFDTWNDGKYPLLIRGMSNDVAAISRCQELAPYDIVYIDADHSLEWTRHDLKVYTPLVRVGGYLVTDDSACNLKLTPWMFFGFQGASDAVDELLPPKTANVAWRYCSNSMHLRFWQRLA